MSQDGSFTAFMTRLRAGDSAAATEIFNCFTHRLIALARTRRDSRLRQKVDAEDVLQSAYKSFFVRQAQGEFDFKNWDSLWGLLSLITLRRCARWNERFHTGARDVNAEMRPTATDDKSAMGWEALADQPTPSHAAMLTETLEGLLRELSERDRAIVTLGLQDFSASEISAQLNRPERTVYRVLHRVKGRLEEMISSPHDETCMSGDASDAAPDSTLERLPARMGAGTPVRST
jgi:RNA polymerase sigma-70 factor (ECF subfamily)